MTAESQSSALTKARGALFQKRSQLIDFAVGLILGIACGVFSPSLNRAVGSGVGIVVGLIFGLLVSSLHRDRAGAGLIVGLVFGLLFLPRTGARVETSLFGQSKATEVQSFEGIAVPCDMPDQTCYAYVVSVTNVGLEDASRARLFISPPDQVTLLNPLHPKKITVPDGLEEAVGAKSSPGEISGDVVVEIDLLAPGQKLELHYLGCTGHRDLSHSRLKAFFSLRNWPTAFSAASPKGSAKVALEPAKFLAYQDEDHGLPLANQTFGALPHQTSPFPFDQALQNAATIYESALDEIVLLDRGKAQDITNAQLIADTLHYALNNGTRDDLLPAAPNSIALHNGYESGALALFNDQPFLEDGKAGDAHLAGFSASSCSPLGFCLVLDGATGGDDAFAIMGQLAAHQQFEKHLTYPKMRYLHDAEEIAGWIVNSVQDPIAPPNSFGGYFVGFPDTGQASPHRALERGKSTADNAAIYAAFTMLASAEAGLGHTDQATRWTTHANVAGHFVESMLDSSEGLFYAGTVPAPVQLGPGAVPIEPVVRNDVLDHLDADTRATLALASSSLYPSSINWNLLLQYVLATFPQTVTLGGKTVGGESVCSQTSGCQTSRGFDVVDTPGSKNNGVVWEAVQATHYSVGIEFQGFAVGEVAFRPDVDDAGLRLNVLVLDDGGGRLAVKSREEEQRPSKFNYYFVSEMPNRSLRVRAPSDERSHLLISSVVKRRL